MVIVNKLQCTLEYKDLFASLFTVLLSIYQGVELLGQMVILCSAFRGTTKLFSTVAILYFYQQCWPVLIFYIDTCLCVFFNYSHPRRYEVTHYFEWDDCLNKKKINVTIFTLKLLWQHPAGEAQ